MNNNSPDRTAKNNKYLIALIVVITAVGIDRSYSISMALITTFTLAYISKGSRSG